MSATRFRILPRTRDQVQQDKRQRTSDRLLLITLFTLPGMLLFRLVFIFVGAELLQTFFWTAYVFGVFLIYTAYKMAFQHDKDLRPDRNLLVRLVRRVVPTDARYHGDRLFTRAAGKRVATLLFVVLIAIEATDLIFAIDSVAAVLAITTSTFIVWTANAFAVLGLRSLFFLLAGAVHLFHMLKYGLALVLMFVGLKMVWLNKLYGGHFPITISLGIILGVIAASIALSLIFPKKASGEGEG